MSSAKGKAGKPRNDEKPKEAATKATGGANKDAKNGKDAGAKAKPVVKGGKKDAKVSTSLARVILTL